MPSPPTSDLPRPKSWDEFEDIVTDVLKKRWATPHVTRNGRSGQAQDGVDNFARVARLNDRYAGAQCKRVAELDEGDIDQIVKDAEAFEPPLAEFIIATTVSRDVKLQKHVRMLNHARCQASKFPVEILFWEDLSLELSGDRRLLAKHFPQWSKLDAGSEQPHLSIHWFVEEKLVQRATMLGLSSFSDMEFVLHPYSEDELDYLLQQDKDDFAKAKAFNDEVQRRLSDQAYQALWREYHRREMFDEGARLGLAAVVDNAAAADILITLEFDERVMVFEADRPPPWPGADVKLDLPKHPRLNTERRMSRSISEVAPIVPLPLMPDLASVRLLSRTGSVLVVRDNVVTLRIGRSAPRRRWSFAGDEGVVVAARAGTYRCSWTADAETLDVEQRGELELEATAQPSPLQRRRDSYIGPPIESLIVQGKDP